MRLHKETWKNLQVKCNLNTSEAMINWSTVDRIYRKLLLTQFFTKGWGKPETIKRIFEFGKILADRPKCQALINEDYPVKIVKDEEQSRYRILEGTFTSPFALYLPDLVPDEVKTARFEMIVPAKWPSNTYKPVCIHLAGTGDHGFWRRRVFTAKPLIKEYGIGSLSLENPFYGCRKPKDQLRSSLHNVSDLFVMGGSLMLESLVLLRWLEKNGYGPLGLSGVSMGGHMATLACTVWDKPIPLIPCLSWTSATPVFTRGAMSGSIPWELLRSQYNSRSEYEKEIMTQLLKCPKTDAFRLGKDFALNFPESYQELREFHLQQCSSLSDREGFFQQDNQKHMDQSTNLNDNLHSTSSSKLKAECNTNYASSQVHSNGDKDQQILCNYQNQTTACCSCPRCAQKLNDKDNINLASAQTGSSEYDSVSSCKNQSKGVSSSDSHKTRILDEINLKVEAAEFMQGVMDVTTFIGNFSIPVDTQMVISVLATQDAYIPRDNVPGLETIWPGVEVMRYVSGGHVTSALFKQHYFRQAINDAFQKYLRKYPIDQGKKMAT
ncbi:Protein ABHD18 [Holothuria leucospilota]|uniref:Protein ABHD18 n=1 Tax=Holothuria leucospilota TaxID=206669 RepID=A0A9Q1H015_HOLLE|nr:Protein ABHD18 [Holothuria leucospilota]